MRSRRRNLVRPIFCAGRCFIPLTESSAPSSVLRTANQKVWIWHIAYIAALACWSILSQTWSPCLQSQQNMLPCTPSAFHSKDWPELELEDSSSSTSVCHVSRFAGWFAQAYGAIQHGLLELCFLPLGHGPRHLSTCRHMHAKPSKYLNTINLESCNKDNHSSRYMVVVYVMSGHMLQVLLFKQKICWLSYPSRQLLGNLAARTILTIINW